MLIRIRSKDGNFRYDIQPSTDVSFLVDKIIETSQNADPLTITISNQPRGNEVNVSTLKGRSISELGFQHGDLIFVGYKSRQSSSAVPVAPATPTPTSNAASRPWETVTEDPVDTYWRSKDGKIMRSRDPQFCKHGAKGMCDYCMPLEPYDKTYHKDNSIKHLSYHAYLQKVSPKSSSDASAHLPPLEQLDFNVKVPCPSGGHASWPAGICTSCQPSAITLQSQPFRMVDHLEIASTDIINRFLESWRRTGMQRFGWLIGHYEPYDKVPMGIKAVVEAICEPPQEGELDGLSLGLPWEDEPRIRALSALCSTPLTIVGYVFTDLDPTEEDRSKNVYKRHANSFYVSSLEAIFAANLQNQNPVASKSSRSGKFSSRLVTAILTGSEDGQVDISAYQMSEQGCAMVAADMIEASVDPGIVRVKEEDPTRYIPDVFFSYKNEYGLEVKKSAKPAFPVEYLLVNVTHGFPQNPAPMFMSCKFAIESRQGFEDQRIENVLSALSSLGAPDVQDSKSAPPGQAQMRYDIARFLSDWHLASFLDTTQLFSLDDMKVLMKSITSPTLLEEASSLDAIMATGGWHSLMTFARESAPKPSGGNRMDEDISQDVLDQIAAAEAEGSRGGNIRICPHCTFENTHGGHDCEVCGLPL